MVTTEANWAGNYTYRATRLHEPETLDELRRVVATAEKIHALGTRHSFNDIADSAELVSLARLDAAIEIDRDAMTVSVGGGVRYGELALALEADGVALHNMASLPHISVAGAVATATHGSGDTLGNLASAVVAMELVTSSGDMLRVDRDDPDFPGLVVNLGALGVVTRIVLRVEPTYLVRQQLFEHLPWETAIDRFDEIMASDTSVSLFTDLGDTVNQVWRKHRLDPEGDAPFEDSYLGAAAAAQALHPVVALSADACTDQLGVSGPWLHRLPHFRLEAMPASGDEIQAEFMVARQHAVDALRTIRELGPQIHPHLWISEVRTVAADDLWMSTAYGTDTACFHFSFRADPDAVSRLLPMIEDALAPFEPRPHWGKVFVATADQIADRYPRIDDFRELASRLDPRRAFRNAFLERHVLG